jgi:hypothetical protein
MACRTEGGKSIHAQETGARNSDFFILSSDLVQRRFSA